MMIYYDLTIPLRCVLILGLFLEFCFSAYLLSLLRQRKKQGTEAATVLAMIVSITLMIIYTAEARANLRNLTVPSVSDWLCHQSIWFPIAVILLILLFELHVFRDEMEFLKNTITRFSIKEGIDKISSGLCFYQHGGRVILANQRMNALCFQIVGTDLQNAQTFWEQLCNGTPVPGVERLEFGNQLVFRLTDGSVWRFSCEEVEGIFQLSAADTTQIHAVTEELKQKNIELAALNLRLRKYGEDVDELTRSKERLETKSRIHGELGQALLASRRYLLGGSDAEAIPLEQWRGSIAMLRKEAEQTVLEKPLEMLQRIAASTGISTEINGVLPASEAVQKLFVEAAAEALTNAISHAQAKTLYIDLEETAETFCAAFRNDGIPPHGEIIEGGGLGSLRKKLEREGGTMTIMSSPDFVLSVQLPKKGGNIL